MELRRWLVGNRGRRVVPASLVEPERRILVPHQEHVGGDTCNPAVEPEDEVEEAARVARSEEQRDTCEEDEYSDQPRVPPGAPDAVVVASVRGRVAPAAEKDPDDDVLRDREQPPLHEHEPARQPLGVRDLESRRVVRHVVEREGRVAIRAQRCVRVEGDPPRPAHDPDVEVEDRARVAPREEDREERDHGQHEERQPEEREHDVVRDRERPLHEPEPAADVGVELAFQADGIRRSVGVSLDAGHSYTLTSEGSG